MEYGVVYSCTCTVVPHSGTGMSCADGGSVQNDAAVAASNNETVPSCSTASASTSNTMSEFGFEEEAWMQIEGLPP